VLAKIDPRILGVMDAEQPQHDRARTESIGEPAG
jgi:hypothetical protein